VSAGDYSLALAIFVSTFGAAAFAALRLRRTILPGWSGAPARLAEAVVGFSVLIVLAEALGTVGALRRVPFLLACLGVAGGVEVWTRRRRPADEGAPGPVHPPARLGRLPVLASSVLCAALAAQWSARTLFAMANGMSSRDTLWYHMPFAARFVQSGDVTALPPNAFQPKVPFYPANGELLDALAMLPFHHDFAAGLVNLAALALALLAGWCIGRAWGVAPATLVAVAAVLAAPIFLITQPGNANNDVLAVAFLLSAVALWVTGRSHPGAVACAGLAAGAALGTKLTVAAAVGALTLAVLVVAPRPRRAVAAAWCTGLVATGGYWFARNLVAVGSPLPAVKLGVGDVALPHFSVTGLFEPTFADTVGNGEVWRDWTLPALSLNFSRAWYALLGLAALGLLAALATATRQQRALAAVGVVAAIGFALTPGTGSGAFYVNARFLAPVLALGLVLVPAVAARRGEREARWAFAGLAALAALVEVLAFRRWQLGAAGWELTGAGVVAAAGLVALAAGRRVERRGPGIVAVAAILVAATGGWFLQRHDTRERYAAGRPGGELFAEVDPATLRLYATASRLREQRLAVAGYSQTYPLFGVDLSNRVEYVTDVDRFRRQRPVRGCAEWRRRLRAGRYGFVVVSPTGYPFAGPEPRPEAQWTRSSADAKLVGRAGALEVFRLRRPPSAAGC
jgi:hypothetical protein